MSAEAFDIDALLFGTKRCAACGSDKPRNTEQFGRDCHELDGLHHTCRECRSMRERQLYVRHPRQAVEARV